MSSAGSALTACAGIVVMNGHFENCWPSVEGVDLGLRELRRDGIADMQVMRLEYWDFVGRDTLDKLFPEGFPGTELEHASLLETSLMMVLRPDLVDMAKVPSDGPAKFPNYDRTPVPRRPRAPIRRARRRAAVDAGERRMADRRPRIADCDGGARGVRPMSAQAEKRFFEPVDAAEVPRFAGMPTFMRLPVVEDFSQLDIALVGVPFDGGTTNRAGTRHGPREIRNQSSMIRRVHHVSGIAPYERARIADGGDCPVNPIDLMDALAKITAFFSEIRRGGARPIAAGGDHLITLPILRALAADGPLGLIHFDAHSDTNDRYFGDNPYTHGTPFRRAVEEGLLDPKRMIQVGIRGSIYDPADYDFAKANGIRVMFIEEFARRGVEDVAAEIRDIVGGGTSYLSFDIDVLDPSQAPGTGTPEIGGMSTREAQAMIRALSGIKLAGADIVEVSPPFDFGGITALTGATMMFEILCIMAEAISA